MVLTFLLRPKSLSSIIQTPSSENGVLPAACTRITKNFEESRWPLNLRSAMQKPSHVLSRSFPNRRGRLYLAESSHAHWHSKLLQLNWSVLPRAAKNKYGRTEKGKLTRARFNVTKKARIGQIYIYIYKRQVRKERPQDRRTMRVREERRWSRGAVCTRVDQRRMEKEMLKLPKCTLWRTQSTLTCAELSIRHYAFVWMLTKAFVFLKIKELKFT